MQYVIISSIIEYNFMLLSGGSGFYASISSGGWEFFSSPPCPEWLWGPPNLLSYGYQRFLPRD